jgi:hypothetical protein
MWALSESNWKICFLKRELLRHKCDITIKFYFVIMQIQVKFIFYSLELWSWISFGHTIYLRAGLPPVRFSTGQSDFRVGTRIIKCPVLAQLIDQSCIFNHKIYKSMFISYMKIYSMDAYSKSFFRLHSISTYASKGREGWSIPMSTRVER